MSRRIESKLDLGLEVGGYIPPHVQDGSGNARGRGEGEGELHREVFAGAVRTPLRAVRPRAGRRRAFRPAPRGGVGRRNQKVQEAGGGVRFEKIFPHPCDC